MITIRNIRKEDLPGIMKLNNELYSYNWSPEFYKWQYFENVHPTEILVADDGDSIAGTFGVQKRYINNNIFCGQITWINISDKYRGHGLFTQLSNSILKTCTDLDAFCIFANNTAVEPCKKALQMIFPGRVTMFEALASANLLKNENYSVENITRETTFKNRPISPELFQLDRSPSFRTWRFALSPVYSYQKISLLNGDFAVTKIFKDKNTGESFGDIVDFETDLLNEYTTYKVLNTTATHLFNSHAKSVMCWAIQGSLFAGILDKLGFHATEKGSNFGIRPIRPELGYLRDFSKWHLVPADATNY